MALATGFNKYDNTFGLVDIDAYLLSISSDAILYKKKLSDVGLMNLVLDRCNVKKMRLRYSWFPSGAK